MQPPPPIRKAVIPAAGLGTRFLPASAAVPKEMLPLGCRPALEWILEEALAAGIEQLILVLSADKQAIRDYFAGNPERIRQLEAAGKTEAARWLRRTAELGARLTFVEQEAPLGLGHAVSCAEEAVADEPFAVLLGDAPILGPSASAELADCFRRRASSVLGVRRIAAADCHRYGIVGGAPVGEREYRVAAMVEKPAPSEAPGDLAISGRYVLSPAVFRYLREGKRGKGNEIQLTDALIRLLEDEPCFAREYRGTRYDIGSPEDYAAAVAAFAAQHAKESA